MDRDLSDQSTIILCACCDDFDSHPFKLLNSWMLNEEFDGIISEVWLGFGGFGTSNVFLLNKLKRIKMAIRD